MTTDLPSILSANRAVPVAVFDNADMAVRVSDMLLHGGISVVEITLRTDAAFDCIAAVAERFPEMALGAGSVLSVDSLKRAVDAGTRFAVAPCLDTNLLDRALKMNIPFIPGVATPSELRLALKYTGLVKVFPAGPLGGPEYMKSMMSPFALMDFSVMPTGGIGPDNLADYLALDRVAACGMSWMVDHSLLSRGKYSEIGDRIGKVARLAPGR